MSDIAIKVENLGKLYRLGEVGTGTLSQDLKRWWALTRGKEDPFAKVGETNDRTKKGGGDFVWALKDVSFEVKEGEVLGIIGRNGAGKSTLLKLLSKVTQPTTGNIKIKGRIASLLEVGTGFHPDLTGRENVFLNGAILGMTKKEIQNKFDEIVDFAGVERYIDTPVKRYSSGMYVRLAFAVAAFLEPEILIIDEVLAVGDAEFQKKCMGRMKDVSVNDGRTVLFVSHDMNSILRLCNHVVLLQRGSVKAVGHANQIINSYIGEGIDNHAFRKWEIEQAPGNDVVRILEIKVIDDSGNVSELHDIRKPLQIMLLYKVIKSGHKLTHAFVFHNESGVRLFDSHDINSEWQSNTERNSGLYQATITIPGNFFAEGKIKVSPAIITSDPFKLHVIIEDALAFMIVDQGNGDSARGKYVGTYHGLIRPVFNWNSKYIGE